MKTRIIVKTTFTENDQLTGAWIIRNSSPLGSTDLGFACTVIYKIGFMTNPDGKGNIYTLISAFTDGMIFPIGDKKTLIDKINADDYRPLTKEEYIKIISSTNQGFLEY